MYCLYTKSYKAGKQPCSQALSSSSLVTGRKTLVAAGHITTQNLVKKFCWVGGVACYDCFHDILNQSETGGSVS